MVIRANEDFVGTASCDIPEGKHTFRCGNRNSKAAAAAADDEQNGQNNQPQSTESSGIFERKWSVDERRPVHSPF